MEPDLLINHHQRIYPNDDVDGVIKKYPKNLIQMKQTDQIKELQTVLRDKQTSRSDFIFYADRLIRLVVEEGLNQLPYLDKEVTTPSGFTYKGLEFMRGNCGVSIMRSGEAMERGLRDCCRSIRIGKILVQTDPESNEAKVFYAKLPPEIEKRKLLLMYPIMSTGNTIMKAISILKEHHVKEDSIILITLFATPSSIDFVLEAFPQVRILTSEVHSLVPNHFGQKYFGTD